MLPVRQPVPELRLSNLLETYFLSMPRSDRSVALLQSSETASSAPVDEFPNWGVLAVMVKKISPSSPIKCMFSHISPEISSVKGARLTETSKAPYFLMIRANRVCGGHRFPNLEPRCDVRSSFSKDSQYTGWRAAMVLPHELSAQSSWSRLQV